MLIDYFYKISVLIKLLIKKIFLASSIRNWLAPTSFIFVGYVMLSNIEKLLKLSLGIGEFSWLVYGTLVSLVSLFVNGFAWQVLLM